MFDKILRSLEAFAQRTIEIFRQLFLQSGKNATGQTLGSLRIETEIDFSSGAVEFQLKGSKVFDYINNGRPAGSKLPPQGSLLGWMAIRGIPEEKEYAVRKSIAEKGIEPYPIIELTAIEIQRTFNRDVSSKLAQELSGLIFNAVQLGFKL